MPFPTDVSAVTLPDEPSWPEPAADCVVVIVDAASGLERKLIESWVERHKPAAATVELIDIPPSRRRKRRHDLGDLLANRLEAADNPVLLPVRIAWLASEHQGRRSLRLRDFMALRDPRDPDVMTQHVTLRRRPDQARLIAGEPTSAAELMAAWHGSVETMPKDEFVARRAWLSLERAERHVRGTRYKIPKFVHEEILRRADFQDGLEQLAPEVGRPVPQMRSKAARYLKEIAASHSPFVIDLVASGIRFIYRQGYRTINYDAAQFQELYHLGNRYPLVFLPSHKSNLDHLVLQYSLWENDLPPNHTAGGINMNFFPVGPLIRRTGVFFIRRTFKDNPTYKFVLRSYIEYLIEKRFPLEWYLEGGRSRTGKLLPPRYGMLSYVAEAFGRGKTDDVLLIPTAITYDHIQEVGAYAAEQRGESKEKESVTWMVRQIRSLRRRYGNIHLRFGEPVSLAKELDSGLTPDEQEIDIAKIAFEVMVRINRVTPITPTSLATVALLAVGDRAVTRNEVAQHLSELVDRATARGLPATEPLAILRTTHGLDDVMDALAEHGIVTVHRGGPEDVYQIARDQHLAAAYYRNTILHFFVNAAIAEVALAAIDEAGTGDLDAFWIEVRALRDLLKFEFFFAERSEFQEEIHQELTLFDPNWEKTVTDGSVHALLESITPLSAPWALRSFIEAYLVVAEELESRADEDTWDEKSFIAAALGRGEQYKRQRRLTAGESVSKSLFEGALKLAANRDLLESDGPDRGEQRQALAAELRRTLRRIDALEDIERTRRSLPDR